MNKDEKKDLFKKLLGVSMYQRASKTTNVFQKVLGLTHDEVITFWNDVASMCDENLK